MESIILAVGIIAIVLFMIESRIKHNRDIMRINNMITHSNLVQSCKPLFELADQLDCQDEEKAMKKVLDAIRNNKANHSHSHIVIRTHQNFDDK